MVDLGTTPLCENVVIDPESPETWYPLHTRVCEGCFLVQIGEYVDPGEIFTEYAYFSSVSTSWLEHARRFAAMATERLDLDSGSFVVEVASNDGYLLRNFVDSGIRVLGVDPAANVGQVARDAGVPTQTSFFGVDVGTQVREEHGPADLIVANNVFAHVPDIHDLAGGFTALLGDDGVLSLEFPHLLRLINGMQFDTIYHEHYSYLSLTTTIDILGRHGLQVFDVVEVPSHGGSIRVWADRGVREQTRNVAEVLEAEKTGGLLDLDAYQRFGEKCTGVMVDLLSFLAEARSRGKKVVGYGAPGKGNTLLNATGIGPSLIEYTVDRNPYKQDTLLPGSRIPVYQPEKIDETKPDLVVILPWNLQKEITEQMAHIKDWGGQFVIPIPAPEVVA